MYKMILSNSIIYENLYLLPVELQYNMYLIYNSFTLIWFICLFIKLFDAFYIFHTKLFLSDLTVTVKIINTEM